MVFKKKRANITQGQPPEFVEKWKAVEKARLEREGKQIEDDMKALKEKIEAATTELEDKMRD